MGNEMNAIAAEPAAGRTYETLLIDHAQGVTTITLNRPEKMNAFDSTMSRELAEAIVAFDADDATRVIVITGAGTAFSAGADVSGALPPGATASVDRVEPAATTPPPLKPWELRTPIIAAINGAAVGMGITYPMMWDIRIAAEDAKLGFVFTRRGLVPEGNATWLLQRIVGAGRALELLISGRIFTGTEAAAMGLVHRAVPRESVLDVALEMATDIAANTAPASVALTKRMVYRYMESNERWEARREELELFAWAARQPDAREGVRSFLEKRAPEWSGTAVSDLPEGWR